MDDVGDPRPERDRRVDRRDQDGEGGGGGGGGADGGRNVDEIDMVDDDDDEEMEEDEDEDEEDEDDDDDEDDRDDDEDDDGVIDGGVAGGSSSSAGGADGPNRKRSTEMDLVLLIECAETLHSLAPDNPILRRGVTVSIGLEKNTKLSAVFSRYAAFANSYPVPAAGTGSAGAAPSAADPPARVLLDDLEFYHCSLLRGSDTAEASALMKNDRVKVRRVRADERARASERHRAQRESDREYFKKMRHLLPDLTPTGMGCDVGLRCQGKLADGQGYKQEVLTSVVRAHSALLGKRCRWLGRQIDVAREERDRRRAIAIPESDGAGGGGDGGPGGPGDGDGDGAAPAGGGGGGDGSPRDVVAGSPQDSVRIGGGGRRAPPADEMDFDDGIRGLPDIIGGREGGRRRGGGGGRDGGPGDGPGGGGGGGDDRPRAAEVEDYDDEEEKAGGGEGALVSRDAADGGGGDSRSGSPVISTLENAGNMIWINVDHPPEAVKLLLEYCYTNRVEPLGREAFERSCKKADPATTHLTTGPVPPFDGSHGSRAWPNGGMPSVSFPVALAGIVLAEEASLPRLSLMCEVAASQLVSSKSVVEALALSSTQHQRTGNRLPILRKAAMLEHVLGKGPRGVSELHGTPSFARGLDERRDQVVPSLLAGIREAVLATLGPRPSGGGDGGFFGWSHPQGQGHRRSGKRDLRDMTLRYEFEEQDERDAAQREAERRKWRAERWKRRRGSTAEETDPYGIQRASAADAHRHPHPPEDASDMHFDLIIHDAEAEQQQPDAHRPGGHRSVAGGGGLRRIGHHRHHGGGSGSGGLGRGGEGHRSRGSRGSAGGSGGGGGRSSRGGGRRRGNDRTGFI